MFSTPREIAESSSRRRSSRPKAERSRSKAARPRDGDESADERDARREERRLKKLEKDVRKAAEAEALLGIGRAKRSDKRRERSGSRSPSKREKKLYIDDLVSGLHARPSRERRSGSPKQREVRPKHLTHLSRSRNVSLNNLKDSSASPRKSGSEHHRHHRHDHSSAESALSCGRCLKKQRKREERAALEAGREEKAARLERSERAPRERAPSLEPSARKKLRPEGRTQDTAINTANSTNSTNSTNSPTAATTTTTTTATATEASKTEKRPRTRSVARAASPSLPPRRPQNVEKLVQTKERRRKADRAEAEPPRVEVLSTRRPIERTSRQVTRASASAEKGSRRTVLENRTSSHGEPTLRPSEKPPRRLSEGASARRAPSSHGGGAPPTEVPRPILGFDLEDKPEKLIKCVTCLDDETPAKDAAKLACGHWFCNECLKRLFTLSLTDPAHMPPRCCSSEHIPLEHVANLLSYQNKKLWNKKYLEYTTANRIYCPTTDCGEWIQPKDIQNGVGRCQKCGGEVCSMCNGRAHGDESCPQDPDMIKFFETAEKNKYQKCYNCKAMVELERGCNHMTCHCTAQFCYVCGSKWKTCGCPWFNEPAEGPRVIVLPERRAAHQAGAEAHEPGRQNAGGLRNTGPGLGLGLARVNGGAGGGAGGAAAFYAARPGPAAGVFNEQARPASPRRAVPLRARS